MTRNFQIPWGGAGASAASATRAAFGVLYLGSSAKVAFVETILRDHADGRGADCVVPMAELETRVLASIQLTAPLRLVDLTGDGPVIMGIPSDVAGARDQALARAWSAAFHAHSDRPDGVLYPSRLNEERCIALYDRVIGKLGALESPRLLECRDELAVILNDLEVAIAP